MNHDPERDAAARRAARRSWPVRVYRLGHEPPDDPRPETTAEERLTMMWPLALEAWRLAGKPLPEYSRSETPIRRAGPLVSTQRREPS